MDIEQEFLNFKIMTISDESFLWTFTILGAEANTKDWI